ncbi:phosphonopyruvate decarboxylase [uncultured Methanobrevibacter sp.]|uniref:phosphonopyruvate decarboxylase n=1 Tax=uncultured Methanobrevibacter sp. TaxID=253161 RepID=UPI002622864D|nr:phosphonopyruvate decarboxylase [uncultured Methanobrevibacter sp.]
MNVEDFVNVLDSDFYTGVPDSQLKALCNYLMNTYGIDRKHHIIAANEGNCAALAAGYHLATGKVPVVYMQNSGEGNIINPVASLLNDQVYAIPCIFVIGWRGQPGVHDEPQHIYQGEITCKLLDLMDIKNFVISKDTTVGELEEIMVKFREILESGKNVAFVVEKGALTYDVKVKYSNDNDLVREEIIEHIVDVTGEDPIVSTTGKASRELFEIRERNNQSHKYDFLTVGSMGHTSSIALGVAINKPDEKVWCIDGDGSVLMHMGSMAVAGNFKPGNLVHVVINNGAHETVGGMPTVAVSMDLVEIAKSCGYEYAVSVDNFDDLDVELEKVKSMDKFCFIEVLSSIGARDDLGRPTTTALENKENFMNFLKE